ncbi:hypothetical protein N0P70_005425 [Klebsiella michiganensis]
MSARLLEILVANRRRWTTTKELHPEFREAFGPVRTRNELRNLCELGFIRRDVRGYQLAIPPETVAGLIPFNGSHTQHVLIAEIHRRGYVFARQFHQFGFGGATQFLRAARGLMNMGLIESHLEPTPVMKHIKRRVYTFTERVKSNVECES